MTLDLSRLLPDPYSCPVRPAMEGPRAAVSAAHPLAVSAAQDVLATGGSAADAAIAAQAAIAVLMPEAGGIGGDGFFLVRAPDGTVTAVNAAGRSAAAFKGGVVEDGPNVTAPGLVDGWGEMSARFGRLPLAQVLAPAVRLARDGFRVRPETVRAVETQKARLVRGGAQDWPFFTARDGDLVRLPALARTLAQIGGEGARWFYDGPMGAAVAAAVGVRDGMLSADDMARHRSVVAPPLSLAWKGLRIHVQPPMSQGVLLLMALKGYDGLAVPAGRRDHAGIELTQATFAFRDRVAEGARLLDAPLPVDLERAGLKGGPRSYLHTAGVSTADADGMVVTSLLSVFDDFGSAIHVPEGGFTLNNRGAGFTTAPNDPRPDALPVHTLAPILVEDARSCFGLSTPGADGQVQTLLQILIGLCEDGLDLPTAIDRPRWRSEDGNLLVEAGHPGRDQFLALGHRVADRPAGATRFGAVACAGVAAGRPFAVSDWRRENWSGVC